jgi:hypothetical protein
MERLWWLSQLWLWAYGCRRVVAGHTQIAASSLRYYRTTCRFVRVVIRIHLACNHCIPAVALLPVIWVFGRGSRY